MPLGQSHHVSQCDDRLVAEGTELLSSSPTYKARIKASHLIHRDDTHPARLPFPHYNTPIHMFLKRPNSGRYTFSQKAGGLFDRAGPRPVALAIGRSATSTPTSTMLDLEASVGRDFVVLALEQVAVLLPVWCGRAFLLCLQLREWPAPFYDHRHNFSRVLSSGSCGKICVLTGADLVPTTATAIAKHPTSFLIPNDYDFLRNNSTLTSSPPPSLDRTVPAARIVASRRKEQASNDQRLTDISALWPH